MRSKSLELPFPTPKQTSTSFLRRDKFSGVLSDSSCFVLLSKLVSAHVQIERSFSEIESYTIPSLIERSFSEIESYTIPSLISTKQTNGSN